MALNRRRIVQTCLLMLLYLAMGLVSEITGPTLVDLKHLYKTNYESLSRAIAGRSIGGIFGALLAGPLVDRYEDKWDVCLCILTTCAAMATLYVPLAADVGSIWYSYFVLGLAVCTINILCTRLILKIWEDRSSTVLQLMLTVYGIGALLIPLICSPFLVNTDTLQSRDDDASNVNTRVHVPYVLVTTYLCMVSVFLFTSYLMSRNNRINRVNPFQNDTQTRQWREYINPATYANGHLRFGTAVLVLMFAYYFNYAGCEKIFANFVRTFSIDVFQLSKTQASYINTVFWSSFTIGRLLTTVSTRFVTTKLLVLLCVVLHFGSVCLMSNYATESIDMFWMCTFIEGLLMAPLFGLVISYGNSLIQVKGFSLTVIIIASSLGQWVYINYAGIIYDEHGPTSVLNFLSIPACMLVVFSVTLVFAGRLRHNSGTFNHDTIEIGTKHK